MEWGGPQGGPDTRVECHNHCGQLHGPAAWTPLLPVSPGEGGVRAGGLSWVFLELNQGLRYLSQLLGAPGGSVG